MTGSPAKCQPHISINFKKYCYRSSLLIYLEWKIAAYHSQIVKFYKNCFFLPLIRRWIMQTIGLNFNNKNIELINETVTYCTAVVKLLTWWKKNILWLESRICIDLICDRFGYHIWILTKWKNIRYD